MLVLNLPKQALRTVFFLTPFLFGFSCVDPVDTDLGKVQAPLDPEDHPAPTAAGVWVCQSGVTTRAERWSSPESFKNRMGQFAERGYQLVDVEHQEDRGRVSYAGVWQTASGESRLSDALPWSDFLEQWKAYQSESVQPIDIETFSSGRQRLFFAVWKPGRVTHRVEAGLTEAELNVKMQDSEVLDFEAYRENGSWLFAAILAPGAADQKFVSGLDWKDFEQFYHDEGGDLGGEYVLIDIELLGHGTDTRYAGLWTKGNEETPYCESPDHLWVGSDKAEKTKTLDDRIAQLSEAGSLLLVDLEFNPPPTSGLIGARAEAAFARDGALPAAGPSLPLVSKQDDVPPLPSRTGDPIHDGGSAGPPPPGGGD